MSSSSDGSSSDGDDDAPEVYYQSNFYYLQNTLRVGLHSLKRFSGSAQRYILNFATLHVCGHESADAILQMLEGRNPGLVGLARSHGWCMAGLCVDDGTVVHAIEIGRAHV